MRTKERSAHAATFAAGLSSLAVLSLAPAPAEAAENGIGFYLLGGRGPMAGYIPPPGFYVQDDFYYYSGSIGGNKQFPAGGQILAEVNAQIVADFLTATWVLPTEVFGGNLAVGLLLPFGQPDVSADVLVNPVAVNPVSRRATDSAFIFGDPVATMSLGWHSGNWHWNVTGLLNIPVGDYREGEIANLAFHRVAADVSGAITWLDPTSGWEASAAVGVTFNGTNPVTEYTTGTEFHAEWAVTKMLTKQFSLGLVGYFYDQITGDSGPGARLGPFEGRAIALGGTVAYNFEFAGTPLSTRVKIYREFDVVNRLEGTAGYFTVAFPVTGAK
ncbi:SphA family protein [Xanthobacter versatilis]|uniref:SphA family protein n=1 Tax=Xanthobacter autotrophicus (strain ATCC BAA-1158 / Py2) TaxID=78245 RepID=UPI00372934A3